MSFDSSSPSNLSSNAALSLSTRSLELDPLSKKMTKNADDLEQNLIKHLSVIKSHFLEIEQIYFSFLDHHTFCELPANHPKVRKIERCVFPELDPSDHRRLLLAMKWDNAFIKRDLENLNVKKESLNRGEFKKIDTTSTPMLAGCSAPLITLMHSYEAYKTLYSLLKETGLTKEANLAWQVLTFYSTATSRFQESLRKVYVQALSLGVDKELITLEGYIDPYCLQQAEALLKVLEDSLNALPDVFSDALIPFKRFKKTLQSHVRTIQEISGSNHKEQIENVPSSSSIDVFSQRALIYIEWLQELLDVEKIISLNFQNIVASTPYESSFLTKYQKMLASEFEIELKEVHSDLKEMHDCFSRQLSCSLGEAHHLTSVWQRAQSLIQFLSGRCWRFNICNTLIAALQDNDEMLCRLGSKNYSENFSSQVESWIHSQTVVLHGLSGQLIHDVISECIECMIQIYLQTLESTYPELASNLKNDIILELKETKRLYDHVEELATEYLEILSVWVEDKPSRYESMELAFTSSLFKENIFSKFVHKEFPENLEKTIRLLDASNYSSYSLSKILTQSIMDHIIAHIKLLSLIGDLQRNQKQDGILDVLKRLSKIPGFSASSSKIINHVILLMSKTHQYLSFIEKLASNQSYLYKRHVEKVYDSKFDELCRWAQQITLEEKQGVKSQKGKKKRKKKVKNTSLSSGENCKSSSSTPVNSVELASSSIIPSQEDPFLIFLYSIFENQQGEISASPQKINTLFKLIQSVPQDEKQAPIAQHTLQNLESHLLSLKYALGIQAPLFSPFQTSLEVLDYLRRSIEQASRFVLSVYGYDAKSCESHHASDEFLATLQDHPLAHEALEEYQALISFFIEANKSINYPFSSAHKERHLLKLLTILREHNLKGKGSESFKKFVLPIVESSLNLITRLITLAHQKEKYSKLVNLKTSDQLNPLFTKQLDRIALEEGVSSALPSSSFISNFMTKIDSFESAQTFVQDFLIPRLHVHLAGFVKGTDYTSERLEKKLLAIRQALWHCERLNYMLQTNSSQNNDPKCLFRGSLELLELVRRISKETLLAALYHQGTCDPVTQEFLGKQLAYENNPRKVLKALEKTCSSLPLPPLPLCFIHTLAHYPLPTATKRDHTVLKTEMDHLTSFSQAAAFFECNPDFECKIHKETFDPTRFPFQTRIFQAKFQRDHLWPALEFLKDLTQSAQVFD